MKNIIAWFAENRAASNLLMLFFVLAGAMALLDVEMEIFPSIELNKAIITLVYPNASPEEIEESAVVKIEKIIGGLAGVKEIDSGVKEGHGKITVKILKNWDVELMLDEIKAKIDAIDTFPEGMEKPVVKQVIDTPHVLNAAVFGDVSEAVLKKLAEDIRDDIANLPEVSLAKLRAVREEEIHVEISEKELRKYNITLEFVADIIKKESFDLPGGKIKTENREILIRTKGRKYQAKDYNEIVILSLNDGSRVKLGQIASVSEGFEDTGVSFSFDDKPAAMIQVLRISGQNVLDIADAVKRYVKEKRLQLPNGIDIKVFDDKSITLKKRVNLLLKNLFMGLVLVCVILSVFLDFRLSFWITLGVPISFMFAISLLSRFDVSINMVSLFAFILVLGVVVDDAIIIGENIFNKRERGFSALDASIKGASEVGGPVIFAALTTMAAFWPMLMVGGFIGKMMRGIPVAVILVLIGSLAESLLILPSHLRGTAFSSLMSGKERFSSAWLKRIIKGPYRKLLRFCLNWRYPALAFSLCLLLAAFGLLSAGIVQFTFFPKMDGDTISCYVAMPAGASAGKLKKVIKYLEKSALEAIEEAEQKQSDKSVDILKYRMRLIGLHTQGTMGIIAETDANKGQIWLQLSESDKRETTASEITRVWREKAGLITEAESVIFVNSLHSAGPEISVYLSMDDQESLLSAAEELKKQIGRYKGTCDIADSLLGERKEIRIKLKPEAGALGFRLDDLASQVKNAFGGAEALKFQRSRNEVKLIVRYPANERESFRNMETMRIKTKYNTEVPFLSIAEVQLKDSYTIIQRFRGKRAINVTADVYDKAANANEIRNNLRKEYLPKLKRRFPGLRYSFGGSGQEQMESTRDLQKGFVVALFAIYALLAVFLNSFAQPLVIMAAVPFGFAGAVTGHLLMGYNLSMLSLFGIVGLAGVAVNDSLALINLVNKKRAQKGLSPYDALLQAAPQRFRAIVLTSATTFAGLIPIILERDAQTQLLIPMAVSLAFGVLFAALTTLIFIPCAYMALNDMGRIKNFLTGISASEAR